MLTASLVILFLCVNNIIADNKWFADHSEMYFNQLQIDQLSELIQNKIIQNPASMVKCYHDNRLDNNKLVGVEFAIVSLKSLSDPEYLRISSSSNLNTRIETVAKYLFRQFKLGDPVCNSGLLIVISISDAKISILLGKSLSNSYYKMRLTTDVVGPIFKPHRLRQNYYSGMVAIINHVQNVLEQSNNHNHNQGIRVITSRNIIEITILGLFSILVMVIIGIVWSWCTNDNKKKSHYTRDQLKSLILLRTDDKRNPINEDCVICFSTMTDKTKQNVMTECKHFYHYNCLTEWISKNPSCPLCRKSIKIDKCQSKQSNNCSNAISENMARNLFNSNVQLLDSDDYDYVYGHHLIADNYALRSELRNLRTSCLYSSHNNYSHASDNNPSFLEGLFSSFDFGVSGSGGSSNSTWDLDIDFGWGGDSGDC